MRKLKTASVAALLIASGALAAIGQNSPAGQRSETPTRPASVANTTTTAGQNRPQPCWEQVGISQTVAHQHRQVLLNTQAQVSAVCANINLTPQQRQQQIHQIHADAKQQLDALISPEQEQEIKACQQERGVGSAGGGRGNNNNQDPCSQATLRQTPVRNTPETRTQQPQAQPEQESETQ